VPCAGAAAAAAAVVCLVDQSVASAAASAGEGVSMAPEAAAAAAVRRASTARRATCISNTCRFNCKALNWLGASDVPVYPVEAPSSNRHCHGLQCCKSTSASASMHKQPTGSPESLKSSPWKQEPRRQRCTNT
jgi:hypothetical protein